MRILHTSDWHLGKRLFKLDRTPEHEAFLDWLLETIKSQNIDLLLIAGDVFDTPTPPHHSIQMFYDFLYRVSLETSAETFIIAGNHDSGLLLEAPQALLKTHRVKVWGKLSENPEHHWVRLEKNGEKLDVCALPFFRSYELLAEGDGDAITALKQYIIKERTSPQLLLLHHLAGMYEAAGSEQVIALSGVDSIPSEMLGKFDYVALGHIHKPQRIGPMMYYSGSPIPLRFSETHPKSVVLIEMKNHKMTGQTIPIPVTRAFGVIKAQDTNWREKIHDLNLLSALTPMVEVQLTLSAPRLGIIDEIKMSLEAKGYELLSFLPFYNSTESVPRRNERLFELSTVDLFEEFYATKYPESPQIPDELKQDFVQLVDKVKHAPHST